MPTNTIVNVAALHSANVADYLMNADRRIVSGFRMACEVLGVAAPEAVHRKPAGRPRLADVMKAYTADNRYKADA